MAFRIVQIIVDIFSSLIANVTVEGIEKIPAKGGCIVTANHIGRLEVILTYAMLPRTDLIMLAAEKYQKYAIFRWLARKLDVVWVDRYNADLHTVREVLKRLNRGMIFVVAPEGTRSKTEALQPARQGAAYLASKSGVPIIPVGVTGTEDRVVKDNLKHFRRSKVRVVVGEQFALPPLPKENRDEV
ncbi:MAG: lysophospholipid acyltransferase family protein, partial [Anaerolineales bacterium]